MLQQPPNRHLNIQNIAIVYNRFLPSFSTLIRRFFVVLVEASIAEWTVTSFKIEIGQNQSVNFANIKCLPAAKSLSCGILQSGRCPARSSVQRFRI